MIEGQTITRPNAECDAFYIWFNSIQEQYQENPDKVVIMPNNIKTIFTNWINAFNGLPAQISDTVAEDIIRWDHTALLAELNSRPEDYFSYLGYSNKYSVPAGSSNEYVGYSCRSSTLVPTLLYYNENTKRRYITTDYSEGTR